MSSPFFAGQVVARLSVEGEAVRAYRTTVVEVGDGYVLDAVGRRHTLDSHGETGGLLPIDDFLAHEFDVKGEGFDVIREGVLRDPFDLIEEHEIDGGIDG